MVKSSSHGRAPGASSKAHGADTAGTEAAVRLRTAIGRLGRSLRLTRTGSELSPSQHEVLGTIVRRGPLRLSELAAIEGINPTMLSRIVGKLEAAGYVAKAPDPVDGRVVHLRSTEEGGALFGRIRRERTDALLVALDRLPAGDRSTLTEALPVLEELAQILLGRRR